MINSKNNNNNNNNNNTAHPPTTSSSSEDTHLINKSPNKKNRKLITRREKSKKNNGGQADRIIYKRKDARNIALLSPTLPIPTKIQKNMEEKNNEYKKYTKFVQRREELGAEAVWREQHKEKILHNNGDTTRLKFRASNTSHHPIKFEEEFLREKRIEKANKRLLLFDNSSSTDSNATAITSAQTNNISIDSYNNKKNKFELQNAIFYSAETYTRDFLIKLTHAELLKIKQNFFLNKLETEKDDNVLVNVNGFLNALSVTFINNNNQIHGNNNDIMPIEQEMNLANANNNKNERKIILQLFDRIDINCKGNISWDNFMSYLADSADNDDIIEMDPMGGNSENDSYNLFESKIIPPILKLKYVEVLDCVIGYGGEKMDGIAFFYNNNNNNNDNNSNDNTRTNDSNMGVQNSKIIGKKHGKVIATSIATELSYLVVHFSNLTTVCYDLLTLEEKAMVSTLYEISCIEYISAHDHTFLALGDVTGSMHCFDLCNGIKIKSFKIHDMEISQLIYLKRFDTVLTCSMDGYVKFKKLIHFSDDLNGKKKQEDKDITDVHAEEKGKKDPVRSFFAHDGGVLAMLYSMDPRVIITSGADRTIKAWSPYSLDEVGNFMGHIEPVHDIEIIASSQRLLTLDTSGTMKIWNLQTYLPIQSIATKSSTKISKLNLRLPSMTYDIKNENIVVTDSALLRYRLDAPILKNKTHNFPVLFLNLNVELETILTCSKSELTFWDLSTGNVLKVVHVNDIFNDTSETLSAICSLNACRRLVLGGTKGSIYTICTKTSLVLETLKPHVSEIVSLIFSSHDNDAFLLSLSRDGNLRRHDTDNLHPDVEVDHNDALCHWLGRGENGSLNINAFKNNDVLGMAYSWNLCLIASYASDGIICLWDAVTMKIVGICDKSRHLSDIAMVIFLDPYPAIVSVGNDGVMKLFTVRPHHIPYTCVMETFNDTSAIAAPPSEQSKEEEENIDDDDDDYDGFTSIAWDHAKFQLITGDLGKYCTFVSCIHIFIFVYLFFS